MENPTIVNQLKQQLFAIAASVPTLKGGWEHCHVEMINDATLYKEISNENVAFQWLWIKAMQYQENVIWQNSEQNKVNTKHTLELHKPCA